MGITMMWKLAGLALAAAAIATAPIAGAAPGTDNTDNTAIMKRCTTGRCHAVENSQAYLHVTNPTALQHIPGARLAAR
jgi:hypothetical protein